MNQPYTVSRLLKDIKYVTKEPVQNDKYDDSSYTATTATAKFFSPDSRKNGTQKVFQWIAFLVNIQISIYRKYFNKGSKNRKVNLNACSGI